ncbi:nicotinate-nucleotide adenylyltransferase [Stenotrophomonas sp. MMGLT7]|uniref:nicotinate-nucleotide adenylyltransferase n=1 Tax=Stenotrophomonas sp. MMGLT7 TaxID=2901227 RepID=UPI002F916A6C
MPNPQSRLHLYYGGTFDPFHNGHLAIACAARDELQVPVQLMPAADPPHRPPPGADAGQRLRMLALGIAGQPGLQIDDRELLRARRHPGEPSYTYDTLCELRAALGPRQPIAWLVGADSFAGLCGWHRWRELFALAHFVVAERAGSSLDAGLPPPLAQVLAAAGAASADELFALPAGRVWRLRQPLREESATDVRQLIASGGDWRSLLPQAVAGYIARHRLYGCHAAA